MHSVRQISRLHGIVISHIRNSPSNWSCGRHITDGGNREGDNCVHPTHFLDDVLLGRIEKGDNVLENAECIIIGFGLKGLLSTFVD